MKVFVKVKPKAKVQKVVKREDSGYDIWVKALPIEGKANEAAARALAEFLGVVPSAVRLIGGAKSKTKTFELVERAKNLWRE